MSNNYFTKEIKDRLYFCMKDKGVTSSDLCRTLNIAYPDLKATLEGKSPLYNKWQRKIADTLGIDKEYLFRELYEPKLTEEQIRADERIKIFSPYDVESIEELVKNSYNKGKADGVREFTEWYFDTRLSHQKDEVDNLLERFNSEI